MRCHKRACNCTVLRMPICLCCASCDISVLMLAFRRRIGCTLILAQTDYRTVGARISVQPMRRLNASINTLISHDAQHRQIGIRNTVQLHARLWQRIFAHIAAAHQSPGYRNQIDALFNRRSNDRYQYNGTLAWSHRLVGNIRVSYTHTKPWQQTVASKRWLLTWSKSIRRVALALDLERASGRHASSRSLYLRALIPLGKYEISSYMSK